MCAGVSVCVIARDEERNLAGCLKPIGSLVDEIIVLDTGSTDRTREVAAELGAKVFEFAWGDDFAAARNECLRHASGDWILWLDADDRIDDENCRRLVQLLDQLEGSRADVYSAEVFSPQVAAPGGGWWDTQGRLFRRAANLQWQRRVHEELVPVDPHARLEVRSSDLVIEHVGCEHSIRHRRKLHRDVRLSQLEYDARPNDPLTLFSLGWDHFKLGHWGQALRLLERSLSGELRTRKLYSLLAQTIARLGRKSDALRVCNQGLIEFPDDPELLYYRGALLTELRDWAGAQETLVKLVNLGPQRYVRVGAEEGLGGERARCLLGRICREEGRSVDAELHFRTAIRHHPRSAEAWLGLGQLYLDAGHWDGLRHAAAELRQCPAGDTLAPALEAQRLHWPASGVISP